MATHYKGMRIDELLKDINRLEKELYRNKEGATNVEEVMALIEGEATLAIAKAKLTALLGDYEK